MAIVVLPRFGWRAAKSDPQLHAGDGKDARLGPAAARALKEIEAAESANETGTQKSPASGPSGSPIVAIAGWTAR